MKGTSHGDNNIHSLITLIVIVLLLACLFNGSRRSYGKAFSEEAVDFPVISNDDEVETDGLEEGGLEIWVNQNYQLQLKI